MDFTRDPIIESVITPKEGCKLVVRSSKGVGQEEYFVDAIEMVSFGNTFFYRSLERPKSFLVPASDYEVLEVREARMVLKHVGVDRSIKIAGGQEPKQKKVEPEQETDQAKRARPEKKKERRRTQRRKRGGDKNPDEKDEAVVALPKPDDSEHLSEKAAEELIKSPKVLSSLLPPPPKLISETIENYKDDAMFKDVFFSEPEKSIVEEEEHFPEPQAPSDFGTLESAEEDELPAENTEESRS